MRITVAGRDLLATAGIDRVVRLWDPGTGALVLTIPTHHPVTGCAALPGALAVSLSAGILVIDISL